VKLNHEKSQFWSILLIYCRATNDDVTGWNGVCKQWLVIPWCLLVKIILAFVALLLGVNYFCKDSNISYHRLPSDKHQLQSLKCKNIPNLQYGRVCNEHFVDENFIEKRRFNNDGSF